jgi:Flp pilus assembly protein TadD
VCLPESVLVLFLISSLSLGLSLTGCTGFRAARLYQEGTAALNAGDAELAIVRLGEAGRLEPRASEIQNHLGLAHASAGQQEKALSAFQRAVDLDCSNAAAVHNLAGAQAAILSGRVLAKTGPAGESSDER